MKTINTIDAEAGRILLPLFPPPGAGGVLPTLDGRTFRIKDVDKLIASLKNAKQEYGLDLEHATVAAVFNPNRSYPTMRDGQGVVGWIDKKTIKKGEDGGIVAECVVDPFVIDMLTRTNAAGAPCPLFRHCSPSFMTRGKSNEIESMYAVALVNAPSLAQSFAIANSNGNTLHWTATNFLAPEQETEMTTEETDKLTAERDAYKAEVDKLTAQLAKTGGAGDKPDAPDAPAAVPAAGGDELAKVRAELDAMKHSAKTDALRYAADKTVTAHIASGKLPKYSEKEKEQLVGMMISAEDGGKALLELSGKHMAHSAGVAGGFSAAPDGMETPKEITTGDIQKHITAHGGSTASDTDLINAVKAAQGVN